MKYVSTWDELNMMIKTDAQKDFKSGGFKYISLEARNRLKNEVANLVKEELLKNINSVIYSSYSPSKYIRRGTLMDASNLIDISTKNNEIHITSIAEPNKSMFKKYTSDSSAYTNEQDMLLRWIAGYKNDSDISSPGKYFARKGLDKSNYGFMRKRDPVKVTQDSVDSGDLHSKIQSILNK